MKSKLSFPFSDFRSQPRLKEKLHLERSRENAMPSHSAESPQPPSPHSELEETSSNSVPLHRTEYDMIKLLEAAARFRLRYGIRATRRCVIPDFLKEVKDFVPLGLSEYELYRKLLSEVSMFRRKPCPGSDCPDSQRSLYELQIKAWGHPNYQKSKPHASGSKKRNQKGSKKHNQKADVTKKKQKCAKKEKGVKKDPGSSPNQAS